MKAGASCVWASCCGLLNEVMGTGAVRGQQPGFGGAGPFRFAPSAGYSSYPPNSPHTPSCQACGDSFSVFKRRHLCSECKRTFCSLCSVLQENLRICCTCHLLKGTAFQRPRLMKLRVKDLRRYLSLRNINTDTCREKEDLVDLVLCHQGLDGEDEPDLPTSPTRPLYTAPTTDSAPLPSPSHAEPISRSESSGSTTQLVDSTSLVNLEQTEQTPEVVRRAGRGGRASLSDLSSPDEVERLTVRELKEILARNFVNFSGCCEKWELVERVRRLYRQNQDNHKSMENVSSTISAVVALPPPICNGAVRDGGGIQQADENLCRICMDAVIDCVLLECGHMVTCTKCGKRMSECPICRQYVIRAVHVFRS